METKEEFFGIDILDKLDELKNIQESILEELKIINRVLIMVETYFQDKVYLPVSNNLTKDEEV